MNKNDIRLIAKKNRIIKTLHQRNVQNINIKYNLINNFDFHNKNVAIYLSTTDEVDTWNIIKELDKSNLFTPKIYNDNLHFSKFINNFSKNKFNILECNSPITNVHLDYVIVPLLAFNSQLYRIGYGKGFYDKCLDKLKNTIFIGLAFDYPIQFTPDKHDVPLHYIINPYNIYKKL